MIMTRQTRTALGSRISIFTLATCRCLVLRDLAHVLFIVAIQTCTYVLLLNELWTNCPYVLRLLRSTSNLSL